MLFLVYYLIQQTKMPQLRHQNNLLDQTPNLSAAKIMGLTVFECINCLHLNVKRESSTIDISSASSQYGH